MEVKKMSEWHLNPRRIRAVALHAARRKFAAWLALALLVFSATTARSQVVDAPPSVDGSQTGDTTKDPSAPLPPPEGPDEATPNGGPIPPNDDCSNATIIPST